jgi:hypothetical protein
MSTTPYIHTGLPKKLSLDLFSITQTKMEEPRYIRKTIPQIPVTEASCISGKLENCVYAIEPHVPPPPNELRYSKMTKTQGNTRIDQTPETRTDTKRWMKYGTVPVSEIKKAITRKNTPGKGMTLYMEMRTASKLISQAIKNALPGFSRFMNNTSNAGATQAAGGKSHFGESKIKQAPAAMARMKVGIVSLLLIKLF